MSQNHNITISLDPANNGILILSDNGQTDVDPSDTVTWIIAQNSGISSITGIIDKPQNTDVFDPDPSPVGGSSNWKGTINPNIARGTEENYSIAYTVGTSSYTFDPKIKVNV